VSELAYVTTHFDLPSSHHFVADFLQAKCENGRFALLSLLWALNGTMFILGSLESA